MALSLATLQNNVSGLGLSSSGIVAASRFSNAYASYAASAQDAAGNPLAVNFAPLFYAPLAKAFASYNGTAQTAAAAFGQAFAGYWTGASFTPGIPAPGVSLGGTGIMTVSTASAVTLANTAALQQDLLALFSTTDANTTKRLSAFAAILHKATTTAVSVVIIGLDATPPPTGPLPTTQQGFVF